MTDDLKTAAVGRRAVLAGVAGVAVIPVLAACGSDDGSDSSSGGDTGSTPDPSTSAPADGGGTAEGTRFAASDIPVEGGVIEGKVVVTQPSEGSFKAFDSTCTHQGCAVNKVEDNEIQCPCHGSRYSAEDGSVLQGPANGPLSELSATVEGTEVVVA